jgi:peptide chain release factor 1
MPELNFLNCIRKVKEQYVAIRNRLDSCLEHGSDEYISLLKKFSALEEAVSGIDSYFSTLKELEELKELNVAEEEIAEYVNQEREALSSRLVVLEEGIKSALCPKDEEDRGNAIIEVRAGTGGSEASLFAAELFKMYLSYCALKGWQIEVLSTGETGVGGYREACALVSGCMAFAKLKFEAGVHRVQRVPATEAKGRIHTSTATVAVLPEAKDVQVKLDEKDLRIETCRASGAGGQHVNTTDSAVRIVHIPTGICVVQQDERSQHKNKARALKILRSRILDFERKKIFQERGDSRKEQIGSGERSEKIRTYNFPQNRVTDHRINFTCYSIASVLSGEKLEEVISLLEKDAKEQFFKAQISNL